MKHAIPLLAALLLAALAAPRHGEMPHANSTSTTHRLIKGLGSVSGIVLNAKRKTPWGPPDGGPQGTAVEYCQRGDKLRRVAYLT